MNKRFFLKSLLGLTGLGTAQKVFGKSIPRFSGLGIAVKTKVEQVLIQESALAGFQYYQGEEIWGRIHVGDALELVHDKHNRYDRRAVTVSWQGRMIGHLPRQENTVVSQMLERGVLLNGRITRLERSFDPWERVFLDVWLDVGRL